MSISHLVAPGIALTHKGGRQKPQLCHAWAVHVTNKKWKFSAALNQRKNRISPAEILDKNLESK